MKLIRTEQGKYHFRISEKEKGVLFLVLSMYPVIPPAHQRLSKTEKKTENEELLDAALAEQRQANRRRVAALVRSKSHFKKHDGMLRLTLATDQIEWLLQVLNDVRVGSWLALGSPDGPAETAAAVNDKTALHYWAMEMSAHFQAALLEAVEGK